VKGTAAEFAALDPGVPYTFTITAIGQNGGSSAEGPQSSAVVPYNVPGKPGNLKAAQTAANRYQVTWQAAAANGKAITGYTVRDQNNAVLATGSGSVTGLTVTATGLTRVRVTATNAAGTGAAAEVAVVAGKPTVTINSVTPTKNSLSVKLTVVDMGLTKTCKTTLTPSGKTSASCTAPSFTGLTSSTTYTVNTTVTTSGGTGTDKATAKTSAPPTVAGKVTCINKASNPDPVYCTASGGIGIYSGPSQSTTNHGRMLPNKAFTATCRATGQSLTAGVYNGNKTSSIWLKMSNGYYIPWVWATLANGDKTSALDPC
jgi:hypothetical protein